MMVMLTSVSPENLNSSIVHLDSKILFDGEVGFSDSLEIVRWDVSEFGSFIKVDLDHF